MKGTILALVVSTVAFGGSTLYFWHQLNEEKAQADQVAEANRRLNARVAELEKVRVELANQRFGVPGGPFIAGTITRDGPAAVKVTPPPPEVTARTGPQSDFRPAGFRSPAGMPPAMIKMMKAQMRTQNKKTYFDLKEALRLTDEQANKLLDLITEEQTLGFAARGVDPEVARTQRQADSERIKNEVSDLLGPVKAAEYEDYQKSMPTRMEVAMLAQQFETADAPLSSEQRSRLVEALAQERESVPAPSWSSTTPQEQLQKEYSAWQADYEERANARARSILNSSQLTVYNEYAQFQKEMREQMAAQGNFIRGGSAGGVTTMIAPNVRMRMAPPPPPQQQKSN